MKTGGTADALSMKRFADAGLAAAILIFLVTVTGSIVRVTASGGACSNWLGVTPCILPWQETLQSGAALDFFHRFTTLLVTPLVLITAYLAYRSERSYHWLRRPALLALGLLLVQALLGGLITGQLSEPGSSWVSAFHLGLSLLVQALVVLATTVAFYYRSGVTGSALKMTFQSSFARRSLMVLFSIFLLLVSGVVVAGSQSATACPGWPLCQGSLIPGDLGGWLNVVHRSIVMLTGILLLWLFWSAWRSQRSQTPVLVATTVVVVLFFAQALMGARLVTGFPKYLLVLHQATSVAVWSAMVVQVAAVGIAGRTEQSEREESAAAASRTGLAKSFLMLTKPIVVTLLLVTTFAGMVIGARAWPDLSLTFWTLLGGFLAAGGSGAMNQYIDRFDDEKMQRTQKRPIPSGKLTSGEGLAFGVGIALTSFYIVVAFVNLLAALLVLAGIIYYVLLYSIFLKKMTVQNIVIGGGAGAIPPLVGWAAATGNLNIPSLLLFAVVFLWTPPHFWALSIVRRKDYARAGVPMLPVIRGEKETRWQIFLYTGELVALTLLLPLFGLGGSVYFIGAVLLGAWLLHSAWKVWKEEGNKVAWKMYRYSSMYLAFLFVLLMIDRLI